MDHSGTPWGIIYIILELLFFVLLWQKGYLLIAFLTGAIKSKMSVIRFKLKFNPPAPMARIKTDAELEKWVASSKGLDAPADSYEILRLIAAIQTRDSVVFRAFLHLLVIVLVSCALIVFDRGEIYRTVGLSIVLVASATALVISYFETKRELLVCVDILNQWFARDADPRPLLENQGCFIESSGWLPHSFDFSLGWATAKGCLAGRRHQDQNSCPYAGGLQRLRWLDGWSANFTGASTLTKSTTSP